MSNNCKTWREIGKHKLLDHKILVDKHCFPLDTGDIPQSYIVYSTKLAIASLLVFLTVLCSISDKSPKLDGTTSRGSARISPIQRQ